jgi:hypothetical protein
MTRIAGTIAAIPLSILWCGTATSQSTVSSNQVQTGDVTASQQLDVVTASSDTMATTTSTGNSLVGSVVTGNLDVRSTQTLSGTVSSQTVINVDSDAGPTTISTTASSGNTGSAIISGGGMLTGSFLQNTASARVDAEGQINAPNAQTGDVSHTVEAVANSQQLAASDSGLAASVTQANSATVMANGGAIFGDVQGQGAFTAVGAANNITSVGDGNSSQALTATQVNNGQVTQGTMFVNLGNSEVTSTNATATGDNVNASNTQGPLSVTASQDNESYVRAQAVETSFAFGGATVNATGVGNSVMAGNFGPSVALNNVQVNGAGGVESIASFQGDNGFDAFASSTAMGNSAAAFACSQCGGTMTVQNSQTNYGDAAASTQVGLTSGARSVRGAATAVGNSGTFYVSTPH